MRTQSILPQLLIAVYYVVLWFILRYIISRYLGERALTYLLTVQYLRRLQYSQSAVQCSDRLTVQCAWPHHFWANGLSVASRGYPPRTHPSTNPSPPHTSKLCLWAPLCPCAPPFPLGCFCHGGALRCTLSVETCRGSCAKVEEIPRCPSSTFGLKSTTPPPPPLPPPPLKYPPIQHPLQTRRPFHISTRKPSMHHYAIILSPLATTSRAGTWCY